MNKREFIKNVCTIGACSCTLPVLSPEVIEAQTDDDECKKAKEMNWRLEWRINHAKNQFGMLLNKIEPEISPEVRDVILEEMGRNCAKSLNWAEKYKDNPEGFFKHMYEHSGENISFDDKKKKITVITKERDCDCPIVNSSKTPAYYCNCSLGWQKETYETILGKKVDIELKESVLRGSNRCVFEIKLL
jgi:predicted hydrocarbon binding protein